MFVYRCIAAQQNFPEIGRYLSFGLAVYDVRNGDASICTMLLDLSLDRAFVERVAAQCTRFQLDPVHLMDLAEDLLP